MIYVCIHHCSCTGNIPMRSDILNISAVFLHAVMCCIRGINICDIRITMFCEIFMHNISYALLLGIHIFNIGFSIFQNICIFNIRVIFRHIAKYLASAVNIDNNAPLMFYGIFVPNTGCSMFHDIPVLNIDVSMFLNIYISNIVFTMLYNICIFSIGFPMLHDTRIFSITFSTLNASRAFNICIPYIDFYMFNYTCVLSINTVNIDFIVPRIVCKTAVYMPFFYIILIILDISIVSMQLFKNFTGDAIEIVFCIIGIKIFCSVCMIV